MICQIAIEAIMHFQFGVLMRWRWEPDSKQWVMIAEKRPDTTPRQLESPLKDPFCQNKISTRELNGIPYVMDWVLFPPTAWSCFCDIQKNISHWNPDTCLEFAAFSMMPRIADCQIARCSLRKGRGFETSVHFGKSLSLQPGAVVSRFVDSHQKMTVVPTHTVTAKLDEASRVCWWPSFEPKLTWFGHFTESAFYKLLLVGSRLKLTHTAKAFFEQGCRKVQFLRSLLLAMWRGTRQLAKPPKPPECPLDFRARPASS